MIRGTSDNVELHPSQGFEPEAANIGEQRGVNTVAVYYLDMLGEICPHPLLMAQAKLDKMAVGDCLVIESDFSRSVRNILAWADQNGHRFDVEEVAEGIWQVKVVKC